MTKVLIIDIHAETYRDRLREEFPELQFALVHSAAEASGDLSDIDALDLLRHRDRRLRFSAARRT